MAIFTSGVFPSGGEVGDAGGVVQVVKTNRNGEFSFSQSSASVYQNVLVCPITPTKSSNKILVMASCDGKASRNSGNHSGEYECWLAYNPNNTNNSGDVTSWGHTLGMMTGLGAWGAFGEASIGSYEYKEIHSPNTTSQVHYAIVANRRSQSWFNNEYGGNNGTSLVLMEISS